MSQQIDDIVMIEDVKYIIIQVNPYTVAIQQYSSYKQGTNDHIYAIHKNGLTNTEKNGKWRYEIHNNDLPEIED
jgi:hypothetical protein